MAEVGRQDRQAALWILIGLIPVDERICGKHVPHIVQTWPVTIGNATQTDLPGQCIESSMNLSPVQAVAPA